MSRVCPCTVKFKDRRGVEHSAEVRAASVYEAACRAWAIFKSSKVTEDESYRTEKFIVEVQQEPKQFHVNLEKLLEALDRRRRGHHDNPRKQALRKLLDANIGGTVEE